MQAFGHELAESSFGGKSIFVDLRREKARAAEEVLLYTPPKLSISTREHTVLLSAEVLDLLRIPSWWPKQCQRC